MTETTVDRLENALRALESGRALPSNLTTDEAADLVAARRLMDVRSTAAAPSDRPWAAAASAGGVGVAGAVSPHASSAVDGRPLRPLRIISGWLAAATGAAGSRGNSGVGAGARSRDALLLASAVTVVAIAVGALALMDRTDSTQPPVPAASTALPALLATEPLNAESAATRNLAQHVTATPRATSIPVGALVPVRTETSVGATGATSAPPSATAKPEAVGHDDIEADAAPTRRSAASAQEPTQVPTLPAPTAVPTVAPTASIEPTVTPQPMDTVEPSPTVPARPTAHPTATEPGPQPTARPTEPGGGPSPTRAAVTVTPPPTWTGGVPTADYTPNPDPGPTILPTQWTPAPTATP